MPRKEKDGSMRPESRGSDKLSTDRKKGMEGTYHQKLIQGLEEKLKRQQEEIDQLKDEKFRLQEELDVGAQNSDALNGQIRELEEKVGELMVSLKEKNEMITQIGNDISYFGREMDRLVALFSSELGNMGADEVPDEGRLFLENHHFGNDRDLMMGVNLDNHFLQSSDLETVRYYLYALDSYYHCEIDLHGMNLPTRDDLKQFLLALSLYVKKQATADELEIQGVLELLPADVFGSSQAVFWGNEVDTVHEMLLDFREKYRLGELAVQPYYDSVEAE